MHDTPVMSLIHLWIFHIHTGNEFNTLLDISDSNGYLINTPSNVAVVNGSQSNLSCRNDDVTTRKIFWSRRSPGIEHNQSDVLLYNGFNVNQEVSGLYEVQNDGFLVIISHSLPVHAGKYRCQESGTHKEADSEFVVLGKNSLLT